MIQTNPRGLTQFYLLHSSEPPSAARLCDVLEVPNPAEPFRRRFHLGKIWSTNTLTVLSIKVST
jgi:hypothetical protein